MRAYFLVYLFLFCCLSLSVLEGMAQEELQFISQWRSPAIEALAARDSLKNPYNEVWGYEQEGRSYAILGSGYGLHIIDLSYPHHPREAAYIALSETGVNWRDFETKGHYLYAVADGSSQNTLTIADLSPLPDSVRIVYNGQDLSSSCHNIHIDGDRLYLFDNDRGKENYFTDILSIAQPSQPELLLSMSQPFFQEAVHDGFVVNDTGYFSAGNDGLYCYDLRNLESIQPIFRYAFYPGSGYNHSCWRSEDGRELAFTDEIPRGLPIKVVELDEALHLPQKVQTFTSTKGSTPHNAFYHKELLYVSMYEDGVALFEKQTSNGQYQLRYQYDTYAQNDSLYEAGEQEQLFTELNGCWGVYPYLSSRLILASDMQGGLFVLGQPEKEVKPKASSSEPIYFFPNPCSDYLHVRPTWEPAVGTFYEVMNAEGKTLLKGSLGPAFQIHIGNLPLGTYYLRLLQEGQELKLPFVKE